MNFPKLDSICARNVFYNEMRSWMNYIKVEKEFTFTTDAHVIVRHRTNEIFKYEFYGSLPDEGIVLHYQIVKMMRSPSTKAVCLSEDKKIIELIRKDQFNFIFKLPAVSDFKFPDLNKLFTDKKEINPLSVIALNAKLLNIVAEGMGSFSNILKLEFQAENKNIYVSLNFGGDWSSALGIIMPVMLRE